MLWIWVIVVAAVAGMLMLAGFARWLWRKACRLAGELEVLTWHAELLAALVDRDVAPAGGTAPDVAPTP